MQPPPNALITTRTPTTQLELAQCLKDQEARFIQLAAQFATAIQGQLDESQRQNQNLAQRVTLLDHGLQEEQAHTASRVEAFENQIATLTAAHTDQTTILQSQIVELREENRQNTVSLNQVTHQLVLTELAREQDRNHREILGLEIAFYEKKEHYETLKREYNCSQNNQLQAYAAGSLGGIALAGPVGALVGGLASSCLAHTYWGGREEVSQYRQLVRERNEAENRRRELMGRAPNLQLPSLSDLPVAPNGYP